MDSIGDYQYYRELASRTRGGKNELGSVCSSYNEMLKSLPAERRREAEEWFLALIQQHHMISRPGTRPRLPYSPEIIRGKRDCQAVTYDLSKLPDPLQWILVGYMRDCLISLSVV